MDTEIKELQERLAEKDREVQIFKANKEQEQPLVDNKDKLVNDMFEQAVVHQVTNNEVLQNQVLETAKTYTATKMQTISTNVDTEHKKAVFNNKKDACESYGFNESTTPIWAVKIMNIGYSIMLAIWLFVGSFTFMPVIFIAKKMSVGLKKTWIAVVFALVLYLGVTLVPILLAFLKP